MAFLKWIKGRFKSPPSIQPGKNSILVLIDTDNLEVVNDLTIDPADYSPIDGYMRMMRQVGTIGRVVISFAFAPVAGAVQKSGMYRSLGFHAIACPPLSVNKETTSPTKKDTVDRNLISCGKDLIRAMSGLTHLCLASSDTDFVQFVRWAKTQSLKVIIASREDKLSKSRELAELADIGPDGHKMYFRFSPTTSEGGYSSDEQ